MLIEILSDRVHYWVAKIDLAAIDGQMRPIENPTVQIDVESPSSGSLTTRDHKEDGSVVHPPILHCSPTGSVAAGDLRHTRKHLHPEGPGTPDLAFPVQVRVVPVAERHGGICSRDLRCDQCSTVSVYVDDREESVGKKIRVSRGWTRDRDVIVVGDEEVASGKLTVTIRKKSQPNKPFKEQMASEALIDAVHKDTKDMPFRPLYTPKSLSKKARYI